MPLHAAPRQMPALTPEQLSNYSFDGMTNGELQKLLDMIDTQVDECIAQVDELVGEGKALNEQFDEADAEIEVQNDNLEALDFEKRGVQDMIDRLRTSQLDINQQIRDMQEVLDELGRQIEAYREVRGEIEVVISGRDR